MQSELELSNLEAGLLGTVFLLGYFVTSPWFGARADRGTRKGLIAFGVIVWSVATFASGLATDFWTMVVARVFVGVGEAAYATMAPTIIDDITPPEKKSRTLAIFFLAAPIGSAMGYLIGGFIQARWGWRWAFFVAGPPGLVLALSCLLIEEPKRVLASAKGKVLDALGTLRKIPLFRRGVLGYCAYTWAVGAFSFWAPKYLTEQYSDLTHETADYYFGMVTVIAGAIGTVVGGQWADRTQKAHPVPADVDYMAKANRGGVNALLRVCSIGMWIAAPLTAAAMLAPTPAIFFLCAGLAEVGLFLSTSPVNAIALRSVPPQLRASAMAAQIFAIHLLGDVWSTAAVGELRDLLPGVIAMMSVPVAFSLSAWTWWPRAKEAE